MKNRIRKVFSILVVIIIMWIQFDSVRGVSVVTEITTSIYENGNMIASRSTFFNGEVAEQIGKILEGIGNVKIGKKYTEQMWASNPQGSMDQYCRVNIYKYWLDSDGKRRDDLSRDFIQINYSNDSNWLLVEKESNKERKEFLYSPMLKSGEITSPFIESISISPLIYENIEIQEVKDGDKTTLVPKCLYEDCLACVEVEVDTVQTHNAVKAIEQSWGLKVELSSDGIVLVES